MSAVKAVGSDDLDIGSQVLYSAHVLHSAAQVLYSAGFSPRPLIAADCSKAELA